MKRKLNNSPLGYLFLLPTFILLGLFAYWPFFRALKLAWYETDGLGHSFFVGLANFAEIFSDDLFFRSFKVLGIFTILGVPLGVFGPLVGAKLIHSLKSARLAYAYRVLFVLPLVIPGMVSLLVWRDLYGPGGAINRLLELIGLDQLTTTWLGNEKTVIGAMIFMGVPWVGGVNMLIYLAALLNIPQALYEAVRIEGAGGWSVFRHIELPALRPQVILILILSLLGTIQTYEGILVLTNGGPGNATLVPALYLFKNGFEFGRLGYATALGVILFILSLGLTFLNMKFIRSERE